MSNPLISIIIPHWNGIDVLSECLTSLNKTIYQNIEIIIVDNASADGSQNWIKKNYTQHTLLENEKNFGYAGGCNRGAVHARGEWLLFLNNDTVQEPDWLNHLVNRAIQSDDVAAIQPKILNYYQRNLFDYAGGAGGHLDLFCFPFAKGRIFLEQENDKGQYDQSAEIFWSSGTAFMVRKSVFVEVDGFDETFFAHQEEIDLCWRIHLLGYRVVSEPRAVVYHKNAVSLPMHSFKKYYLNHRNSMLMMLTNYNLPLTLYLSPVRFFLEVIALVYAIVKIDLNHFLAIISSLFWILTHPLHIIRKRKKVQKLRKVKDSAILKKMYKGSIVVQHYFNGIKSYSSIY